MQRVTLERMHESDQGTFGRIYFGDYSWLYTGELPDRDNRPNVSRIPEGVYECLWTYSPKFKRMLYLVNNVPGRSGIRFHSANLMGDKEKGYKTHVYGCIALGGTVGRLEGQSAVLVSRPAMRRFHGAFQGSNFELEVK